MKKIGIVGLGLIGGSIFKDLIRLGYDVIAVSNSQNGDNIFKSYEALKDRDLIFVCTPMNKTLKVLDELEKFLSPQTIVTDVCSLKEFVSKKDRSYVFIPSHPMAGTENKGFENSLDGLFKGASWVITPMVVNDRQFELEEVIKSMGAKIIVTTPKKHDEAVALISHMPMVVAQALFRTAEDNELALTMASSGFRDMTRLALSNEEMAFDMVSMNSNNIQMSLLKLYKSIGELIGEDYAKNISEIKSAREKMFRN